MMFALVAACLAGHATGGEVLLRWTSRERDWRKEGGRARKAWVRLRSMRGIAHRRMRTGPRPYKRLLLFRSSTSRSAEEASEEDPAGEEA